MTLLTNHMSIYRAIDQSHSREDYVEGVDIALNCLELSDNIAVSGSNEGIIRVWNMTTKRFTKRLDCSGNNQSEASITRHMTVLTNQKPVFHVK